MRPFEFLILIIALTGCRHLAGDPLQNLFVSRGEASDVIQSGSNWAKMDGSLVGSGVNRYLVAGKTLAEGDFHIHVRLSLDSLNFSAASVMIGANHFGFDARSENGKPALFVEGPLSGKATAIPGSPAACSSPCGCNRCPGAYPAARSAAPN